MALLLSLFYEEKAEVQGSEATCLRSHSSRLGEPGFEPRQFESGALVHPIPLGSRVSGVVDKD